MRAYAIPHAPSERKSQRQRHKLCTEPGRNRTVMQLQLGRNRWAAHVADDGCIADAKFYGSAIPRVAMIDENKDVGDSMVACSLRRREQIDPLFETSPRFGRRN